MPDNYVKWIWWWFFVVGALGGWAFITAYLVGLLGEWIITASDRREAANDDFIGEYEDPKFGAPMARTRSNMPVYTPRKREGAE